MALPSVRRLHAGGGDTFFAEEMSGMRAPQGRFSSRAVRALTGTVAGLMAAGLISACGGGNPVNDARPTDTKNDTGGDVRGDRTGPGDGGDGGDADMGQRPCEGAECAAPTFDCTGSDNLATAGQVTTGN